MTNGKVKGKAGELRKMRSESGTGQPESGTESGIAGTESGTGLILGRNDMKSDGEIASRVERLPESSQKKSLVPWKGWSGMINTIQAAGPYILAFWFGVA